MVVSDRLTFLAKYREFHKLCQNSDFPTAATLLHSLLWSRLAPKYFWVTLLIDALPFLNTGDLFFTSDQNYELMHCLQVQIALTFKSCKYLRITIFTLFIFRNYPMTLHFRRNSEFSWRRVRVGSG